MVKKYLEALKEVFTATHPVPNWAMFAHIEVAFFFGFILGVMSK